MFQLGLKLWSTNDNYAEEAVVLFKQGFYSYIELYVIPGSYEDYNHLWKSIDVPYVIHAPHFSDGMNLAKKDQFERNMLLARQTKRFADELQAETIIFHPGIAGSIEETARQINEINDPRTIVENKPYHTIFNDGNVCNGNSPEEIQYVLENSDASFCLDIGHCIYSANAHQIAYRHYLEQFLKLKPRMFHLTDGERDGFFDKHYHFGDGGFPINEILSLLPEDATITIETLKDSKTSLSDFQADVEFLRGCKCLSIE